MIICHLLSIMVCNAQTNEDNNSIFFSLKDIPCTKTLCENFPYSYVDLRDAGITISAEDVGKYLNPIKNIIELNDVTHSFENKYRAMSIVKSGHGVFLLYTVSGRHDLKYLIADITEQRAYPPTLELYYDVAQFTYIWYTYSAKTNVIQLNYIEEINNCDISNGHQFYNQVVDEYILAPGFPYIGRKGTFMFELPIGTIPTGNCPNLPPANSIRTNKQDSTILIITTDELESIDLTN